MSWGGHEIAAKPLTRAPIRDGIPQIETGSERGSGFVQRPLTRVRVLFQLTREQASAHRPVPIAVDLGVAVQVVQQSPSRPMVSMQFRRHGPQQVGDEISPRGYRQSQDDQNPSDVGEGFDSPEFGEYRLPGQGGEDETN